MVVGTRTNQYHEQGWQKVGGSEENWITAAPNESESLISTE